MEHKVGFHLIWEFHRPMLAPICHLLQDHVPCLMSSGVAELKAFQPTILVVACRPNAEIRRALPDALVVFVRHGFSSKNFLQMILPHVDFMCVSSEWVREDLENRGFFPRLGYWATGFVPMDPILASKGSRGSTRKTLLYAPTFDATLSAESILPASWIAETRRRFPGLRIVIKPHPHIPRYQPGWMTRWKELADVDDGVVLIDDIDSSVYELFPEADVLLTDVSSVMFYFLAMDRPIVLVANPRRHRSWKFDPQGPEWTSRDMGIDITGAAELYQAIERSLLEPAYKEDVRSLYRKRIFGELDDGRAAERIATRIKALIDPALDDAEWVGIAWNCRRLIRRLRQESAAPCLHRCRRLYMLWRSRLGQSIPAVLDHVPVARIFLRKRFDDTLS